MLAEANLFAYNHTIQILLRSNFITDCCNFSESDTFGVTFILLAMVTT